MTNELTPSLEQTLESELEAEPDESAQSRAERAGQLLRSARQATGLHIAALAASLKVPVEKLQALEDGRLGKLPSAVFTRALTGSVCRALKVDARPVLDLLPQSTAPQLPSHKEKPAAHTVFVVPHGGLRSAVSRPAALVGLLLLCAALALLRLPWMGSTKPGKPSPSAPASPKPLVESPVSAISTDFGTGEKIPAPAARLPADQLTGPAAAALTSRVKFQATQARSWIEVSNAKGTVLLQRNLQAGERAEISGTPPLSVVVGHAETTQVEVNGRAFDVMAAAKNNVARFEVK